MYCFEVSLQEKFIPPALTSENFLLEHVNTHLVLYIFTLISFIILYNYLIQKDCWNQDLLQ